MVFFVAAPNFFPPITIFEIIFRPTLPLPVNGNADVPGDAGLPYDSLDKRRKSGVSTRQPIFYRSGGGTYVEVMKEVYSDLLVITMPEVQCPS